MSYFTDNDIYILKAAGVLIENIIAKQHTIEAHKSSLALMQIRETKHRETTLSVLAALHRKRRFRSLRKILGQEPCLNPRVLEEIATIMNADAALLHLGVDSALYPCMQYGITYE